MSRQSPPAYGLPDSLDPDKLCLSYRVPGWMKDFLGGSYRGRGVKIAVVDSGFDAAWKHDRFRCGVGMVDPGDDLSLLHSSDSADRHGHGTACADVMLRIAPGADLYPVRVFDRRLETSVEMLTEALKWSLDEGMDIVNFSLGTVLESALKPLYAACEQARRQGIILISAVHQQRQWSYPAVFENTIGVRADCLPCPFALRYHPDEAVECSAHGGGRMRWLKGGMQQVFGSSFAAPHVSGLAALLKERYPAAGLEEIRSHLQGLSEAAPRANLP